MNELQAGVDPGPLHVDVSSFGVASLASLEWSGPGGVTAGALWVGNLRAQVGQNDV